MNRKDLASVLFGVAGVFVVGTRLSEALLYLPFITGAAAWSGESVIMYAGVTSSILVLCVGAALAVFRGSLAMWLFPESAVPDSVPPTGDLQAVGFSIVGLYFLIRGLSGVVSSWGRTDLQSYALLLFGLGAFLGARGLSNAWQLLRSTGRAKREPAAQQAVEPDVK
jgi:hypothetical protein